MALQPNGPETTQSERNTAALIHIISIFTPLWVPAIAWFLHRNTSRFIAAHSWQEIVDGILWKALLLLVMLGGLGVTISRLVYHYQTNWETFTWQEIIIRLAISLTLFVVLFTWNLIQALNQARKARAGIWPKRELKKLARANPTQTPLP
ncbi:hypothetical protein C0431_00425 [bacterium]|jgi:hypothetical protein|nr:hypothetical protein [bacterium]